MQIDSGRVSYRDKETKDWVHDCRIESGEVVVLGENNKSVTLDIEDVHFGELCFLRWQAERFEKALSTIEFVLTAVGAED